MNRVSFKRPLADAHRTTSLFCSGSMLGVEGNQKKHSPPKKNTQKKGAKQLRKSCELVRNAATCRIPRSDHIFFHGHTKSCKDHNGCYGGCICPMMRNAILLLRIVPFWIGLIPTFVGLMKESSSQDFGPPKLKTSHATNSIQGSNQIKTSLFNRCVKVCSSQHFGSLNF